MLDMFEQGQLDHLIAGNKLYKLDNPSCLGLVEMVFTESAYFRVRWLGVNFGFNDYPFEMVYDFHFQKGSQMLSMDETVKFHKRMNFFNRDIYLNKEVQKALQTESFILERKKEILNNQKSESLKATSWSRHVVAEKMEEIDCWFIESIETLLSGERAFELERVIHKMGLMDWFGPPERIQQTYDKKIAYIIDKLSFNRLALKEVNQEILKGFRCSDYDGNNPNLKVYSTDLNEVMVKSNFENSKDSLILEKKSCKRKEILALPLFHPNLLNDMFVAF